MKYSNIISEICATPWAITRAKLETIIGIVEARDAGVKMSSEIREQLEAVNAAREERTGQRQGVAVIGLHGTLSHRPSLFTSGGLSTSEFTQVFNQAVQDERIASIVLDVDSPGGSVFGTQEAADAVFASRGIKPITAVANAEAHSAAYHIASQADEFVVIPSGMAGSIGVILPHVDDTEATEKAGYRVEYITAGENKAEGWQTSLSEEYRDHLQSIVDSYYEPFVANVARGRGVSVDEVLEKFGQGRSYGAEQLLQRGMVDRIATFDEVLDEHVTAAQSNRKRKRQRQAYAASLN